MKQKSHQRTKTCNVINIDLEDTPRETTIDSRHNIMMTPEEKWKFMIKIGRAHYYQDSEAFYRT